MIVRCSNCSSAFAVDDTKVKNKKFAFACPKCAHENIIDNTSAKMSVVAETGEIAFSERDSAGGFETDTGSMHSHHEKGTGLLDEEDSFEERETEEDNEDFNIALSDDMDIPLDEEAIGSDIIVDTPEEDTAGFPEIDESGDDVSLDFDIDSDLPELDLGTDDEADKEPVEGVNDDDDVMDISLDYLEGDKEVKSETGEIDLTEDENQVLDELEPIEEESGLNLDAGMESDDMAAGIEEPAYKIEETDGDEDSITFDVDSLDIDFDEDIEVKNEIDIEPESVDSGEIPGLMDDTATDGDESITLDIDSLDIDLDESDDFVPGDLPETDDTIPDLDIQFEDDTLPDISDTEGLTVDEPEEEEESITLDLEELDLDLVEENGIKTGEQPDVIDMDMGIPDMDVPGAEDLDIDLADAEELDNIDMGAALNDDFSEIQVHEEDLDHDESITLDMDSLDLDLVEEEDILEGEIPDDIDFGIPGVESEANGAGRFVMDEPEEDESITIDLDTLDIPLAETEEEMEGVNIEEDESITLEDAGLTFDELTTEEMAIAAGEHVEAVEESIDDDEEDIRITIDEIDPDLDIDSLESDVEADTISGFEYPDDAMPVEEDLTTMETAEDIDLLEMELDDEDEVLADETEGQHPKVDFGLDDDEIAGMDSELEDIKNSLDVDKLDVEYPEVRRPIDETDDFDIFSDDDLPDIDLGDTGDKIPAVSVAAGRRIPRISDEIINLEDELEYDSGEPASGSYYPISRGNVNFSIDYSLAYSRLGAFLRLTGIFLIGLIPHFIVFILYLALSLVLGMLNHIIVLITSSPVEDFQSILEKTLRYYLSINASILGIVEEMPVFTGSDNIDYPLQLNITYSLRNSSLLAALRLSIIGILIVSLPHIIILSLLTIALPAIFIYGIISVLITKRWPHFLFDFMSMYYNSVAKILAYMMGLVDKYPPFKFG